MRGAGDPFWRGWDIPVILVQRCFLWRYSWPLSSYFLGERGYFLRGERSSSLPDYPRMFNTAAESVKPSTQLVYTTGPVAVHDPHGRRETYLQTMVGRGIYPRCTYPAYTRVHTQQGSLPRGFSQRMEIVCASWSIISQRTGIERASWSLFLPKER